MPTLVCIIGNLRATEITWPSFLDLVLTPLQADLALCVPEGPSTPYHERASYVWTVPVSRNWEAHYENLATLLKADRDWRKVLNVGGNSSTTVTTPTSGR